MVFTNNPVYLRNKRVAHMVNSRKILLKRHSNPITDPKEKKKIRLMVHQSLPLNEKKDDYSSASPSSVDSSDTTVASTIVEEQIKKKEEEKEKKQNKPLNQNWMKILLH